MSNQENKNSDHIQWGMVIDVDKCTGCKSCVLACRAENNLPFVEAEQCAMGRLMDWLRIDRYYHGHYPHVHADFVPMLCQQCGTAPCESVCPVFASVHTLDGLNAQIYNRCVGTRVCANNCPYHVRMFNFVQPTWPAEMVHMLNPDVSVRNEGIMEKCTFCVQRIRRGTIDAKVAGRDVHDGEVRPACVQVCSSEAIVFGKLSDPNSTVSKVWNKNKARSKRVLQELTDSKPNVIYLRPERDVDPLHLGAHGEESGKQHSSHSDEHHGDDKAHAQAHHELEEAK